MSEPISLLRGRRQAQMSALVGSLLAIESCLTRWDRRHKAQCPTKHQTATNSNTLLKYEKHETRMEALIPEIIKIPSIKQTRIQVRTGLAVLFQFVGMYYAACLSSPTCAPDECTLLRVVFYYERARNKVSKSLSRAFFHK